MMATGTRDGEQTKLCTMCTMGGVLQVEVKNGEILRVRPLPLPEEEIQRAQWKIEVGNRTFKPPAKVSVAPYSLSSRRKIYNPMRLKYPMKRKGFKPGGRSSPANRGKGEFVRISWEEAIETVATETKRTREIYGPAALLPMYRGHFMWGSVHTPFGHAARFFNMLGTTVPLANPNSWEGWFWGAVHVFGFQGTMGFPPQEDLLEDIMKNSQLIVWWSCDPEKTSWGYPGQESALWRLWIRELGIKQIFIDPYCNYTAGLRANKWIAPRPATDAALASAIAYVWIVESTFDQEYVATHTYGFDKWRDYILGHDDSVPKTPEWAQHITGLKAGLIRALAREWASKRTCLAIMFGGACRAPYGHEWARMMVLLQAMQGLGKPGVNLWTGSNGPPANKEFFFPSYTPPHTPMILAANKVPENPVEQYVYRLLTPESILNPPVSWTAAGSICSLLGPDYQFKKFTYPEPGQPEVKMIYRWGNQHFSTLPSGNRWVKMYKSPKVQFLVVQTPWRGGEAEFADILLPACTNFERNDVSEWATVHKWLGTNYRIIVYQQKCIEPVYESKSDYDIFTLLADKLGFKDEFTEGNDEEDWIQKTYAKSSLPDYMSYERFKEKGYFIVPIPEDYRPQPTFRAFYEKGEKLETPSGKIEFFSQRLHKHLPEDQERPPVPHYLPSWEGLDSPIVEKYPLQLIVPHARYTYHTEDENISWIRAIPLHRVHKYGYDYWPIQIHPSDAEPRGIKNDDLVRAYNDRGAVILIAKVTEKVRPGTVLSVTAGGYDPVKPGKIGSVDMGGAVNLLMPPRIMSANAPGQVTQGLIQIAKWKGRKWRKKSLS
jgi:molybdopterin guanine dinucleotide-containing S/N-oxide reductase-like protein